MTAPEEISSATVMWNFLLGGTAAILVSFMAMGWFQVWEEVANIILGAWLIVSPWVLHFEAAQIATLNAVVSGTAIFVLAAWCAFWTLETEGY